MIEPGTRFIGYSKTVDLSERRTANSNAESAAYTLDDLKGYKVFSALLTQSGGDSSGQANFENQDPLIIGQSYYITDNFTLDNGGTDFTVVGSSGNEEGTWFIATGTTPVWGTSNGSVNYNQGAPVATVLENTLGDVYFTYYGEGTYICHSDYLFTDNKTGVLFGQTNTAVAITKMYQAAQDQVWIEIFRNIDTYRDDLLNNTLIEIRVYA